MGKTKVNKKHSRQHLMNENTRADRDKTNAVEIDLMVEDDRIQGAHIKMFTDLCFEFKDTNIESPLFIINNLALMTIRLEYYQLTMKNVIEENDECVTDNFANILTNNAYVTYLEAIIAHVKTLA
jgi:hypothetical protein